MTSSQTGRLSTTRLAFVGLLCVALLVGGFGGWAALARIDGAVVALGQVVVERNRQEVAHQSGGTVDVLHVSEGSTVARGDVLLSLSANSLENERTIIETQLYDLMARAARLAAERDSQTQIAFPSTLLDIARRQADVREYIDGQENLFAARVLTQAKEREQIEKRKGQITAQIEGLLARERSLQEQRALSRSDLDDQLALLEKGLTQQARVSELRKEVIGLSGELAATQASIAQARSQITEFDLVILKNASDRRESAIVELRDVQSRIPKLREQLAAVIRQTEQLDMRAPVSGTVYDLSIFGEGSVVSPAEPVLYIVPQDRPLVISARIKPTNIDQIYPSQPVRLRLTSFDQRTTPELQGELRRVSPDVFVDPATGASYYVAEISLSEAQRRLLPDGADLVPGMPVETYISTGERTPLAYLIKPLADYFNRAFRE